MRSLVERLQHGSIAVVGDFFLDEYVSCSIKGVSPEMPVLRLAAEAAACAPGAAGNLAANLCALGARVSAVGIVGADADGDAIERELSRLSIDTRGVVLAEEYRTTKITRFLTGVGDQSHHHLRVDHEPSRPPGRSAIDTLLARLEEVASDVQAVFIADYHESAGSPVLSDEDIEEVIQRCRRAGVMVFGTSRTRLPALAGADVILCNEREAEQLGIHEASRFEAEARAAVRNHRLRTLCVTRGVAGASVFSEGRVISVPGRPSREVDPCGAGDSFASAFSLSVVSGADSAAAAELAVVSGGLAVERMGTAPISSSDLLLGLGPTTHSKEKFVPLGELIQRLDRLRAGRKVVFTNGCFDVFHSGHVQFLRQAKELGDVLVVALNSDRSTEANKGPGRPVIPARERVDIVSGLESVDIVTLFDELTPIGIISSLRPDVLVKGGSYSPEDVVGKSLVESHGGEVVVIPMSGSFATKDFIRAVSSASPGVRPD